jgi:hypothetical protein
LLLLAATLSALGLPGAATAHSRARTVALDYTLRLKPAPAGIRADVIDGDRALRLRVVPSLRVVVLGALGEPMLRFDRDGVWANRASPTASADRIVPPGTGWTLLTHGHSLRWHDHRLAPRAGVNRRLAVPLVVDGRRDVLKGTFTFVPRPRVWPWLLGALALVVVVARTRAVVAAALAAATGALVAAVSFGARLETGMAVVLVLATAYALRRSRGRTVVAGIVGAVAVAIALGWLGVFRHGVVVSSLPAWLTRLATGVAFAGGLSAVVLSILEPRAKEVRAVRRDVGPEL